MHTPPTYRCNLGAIGWEHDAWCGVFYPDDMPSEWRLSFYNTEFECTYLPYAVWSRAAPEALQQWREDTLARFRFLLEPAPSEAVADDAARLAVLGEKAILASAHDGPVILWLEPNADIKQLAQTVQARALEAPVYIISVSANYAQLEQARTLLEVLGY